MGWYRIYQELLRTVYVLQFQIGVDVFLTYVIRVPCTCVLHFRLSSKACLQHVFLICILEEGLVLSEAHIF